MTTGIINGQIIIPASKTYFRELVKKIFTARDFANVDQDIATAIKIMVGLQALTQDIQSTQAIDRQRILVTLNKICNVAQLQMAPTA